MSIRARYRHVDAGLIRAAAYPAEAVPPLWSWPASDAPHEQWRAWLAETWAHKHVAEAVGLASPSLAGRIYAVCAGQPVPAGDLQRLAMPLARYLTRMRGRATPFGLFAGVAPLRLGPCPADAAPHIRGTLVRADATWLAEVIRRLESCTGLLARLPVVGNDLATAVAERLVVAWQPHSTSGPHLAAAEVSVRYRPAVRAAVQAAKSPILAADLARKLAAEFPDAPPAAAMTMIAGLVGCGVLITSLRPPSTDADGIGHVLRELSTADAGDLPQVAALLTGLQLVAAELAVASGVPGQDATGARLAAGHRMRALVGAAEKPLLAVDLTLDGEIALPEPVAAEAASAAGALVRLTAHPGGHPGWQDYHARFLDRYGTGAIVSLAQLTDPVAGLGFPSHYTEPDPPPLRAAMSRRDQQLLALAQQAALGRMDEITLDDNMIDQLTADVIGEPRPAPHAELCADLRAASPQALADGKFTLAVTGVSRSALAMTGRFIAALPGSEQTRMIAAYNQLPTVVDGALSAQLSFPPRHPRLENVTRVPVTLPVIVSLAEHHASRPDLIPLEDLAVTADNRGLYVVSLSRHQVIEPTVVNAAARQAMPPTARLLSEIPRARLAALTPFAWGAASCLPFLPRIRYRRSILATARWRISRRALPTPGAPWDAWSAAAEQLRQRQRLPTIVDAGTGDRRLRLSLDQPADLTLLRHLLHRSGETVTISEAPAPADHGWLGGRAHEIVIPVASTAPPARPPAIVTTPAPWTPASPLSSMLPGSRVLFAKLYAHPDCFDLILTAHLPGLLAEWDDPPAWWFVRYRDPAPHLRLRLRLAAAREYGPAAVRVGAWADKLRRNGLIADLTLAAYHPETARYGTGSAMDAAEALFVADSAAAVAQLAMQTAAPDVQPRALTAASLADLACAMTGGRQAGMRWLISHDHGRAGRAGENDRGILRQALTLSCAAGPRTGPLAYPGGPQVTAAWEARGKATSSYAQHVADPRSGLRPDAVLGSLLHMHHARVHGHAAGCEPRCRRLARSIALAWAARTDTTGGNQR